MPPINNPQETLRQVASRARELQTLEPSVSANTLATPPPRLTVPEPVQPPPPDRSRGVVNNVLGSIRSQSQAARDLADSNAMLGSFTDNNSGFDIQNEQMERFGVTPGRLRELEEIQLQIGDLSTESVGTRSDIARAAGQTVNQGSREISAEAARNNVRSYGLAARAAVLQNNLNLGRQLANDAITVALADRDIKLQNLIRQNTALSNQVDDETAQLLLAENRQYEEKLAADEAYKKDFQNAIVSGASQEEIAELTAPLPTNNDPKIEEQLQAAEIARRQALAQSITARGATEMRNLEMEGQRANIDQGWASLDIRKQELNLSRQKLAAELNASGNVYGTIDGKPQNATQALVNGYADRLLESETVFDAVADQFADPLAWGSFLPSVLQSGERQQYEQAKRNFVNAVLRRESGAVIADSEFANAEKQYFPQPGDEPETVLQKEQNRNTVINSFYRQANVPRPVFAGDIIESEGVNYQVAEDGVTLIEI